MKKILLALLFFWAAICSIAYAGEADVVDAAVKKSGNSTFDFSVTVLHKDTGWDHYANKWEIVDEEGKVLGTRILHHPHVDEQPFTRSLFGAVIPTGVKTVLIRAHDSVHAYGGKTITVKLP